MNFSRFVLRSNFLLQQWTGLTRGLSTACIDAFPFPSYAVGQEYLEVLRIRASTSVDPNAVTGTTCIDTTV
jgi:hypothetical protein